MLTDYFIGFLILLPVFAVLSSSVVRGYLLILWRRWIGFPHTKLTPTEQALRSVAKERQAQAAKWGRGVFPSAGLGFGGAEAKEREVRAKAACDAAEAEGRCTFAHVLREEVAELIATETHHDALTEAVQVGAVVVKLIEYLRDYDSLAVRPLRVYVAAESPSKLIAATLASRIHDQGHVIVSRWHKEPEPRSDYTNMLAALRDRTKAIRSADVMVAWSATDEPHAVVGDVGYALAFGLPVLWVKRSDEPRAHLYEAERRVTVLRLEDTNAIDTAVAAFVVMAARIRKAAER